MPGKKKGATRTSKGAEGCDGDKKGGMAMGVEGGGGKGGVRE